MRIIDTQQVRLGVRLSLSLSLLCRLLLAANARDSQGHYRLVVVVSLSLSLSSIPNF